MRILFVCAANINRSFMAERILQGMLKKAGKADVEVTSAALSDLKGAAGDPVAAEMLTKKGFRADNHQSKMLNPDMVREADMVIAMEHAHKELLVREYPDSAAKIHLLKSFSSHFDPFDQGIKDCYRKSSYHYRLCFSEIFLSIEGLLKCI